MVTKSPLKGRSRKNETKSITNYPLSRVAIIVGALFGQRKKPNMRKKVEKIENFSRKGSGP